MGLMQDLADDDARVVFLELNPRIQVEHTITEQMVGVVQSPL